MQRGVLPEDRKEDSSHPDAGTLESRTEQEAVDAQQGPAQVATEEQVKADQRGFFNTWCKIRYYLRQPLAEWFGVGSPWFLLTYLMDVLSRMMLSGDVV